MPNMIDLVTHLTVIKYADTISLIGLRQVKIHFIHGEQKFSKKGRIDHLLITPKLMPFVSEARYVFHEHEISDNA